MSKKRSATSDDLEILIDNHPDPMVLADINGIIWAINSKLASVLGKPKDEIIGTSGFSLIGKNVINPRKKAIEKVVKTKKPFTFEDKDKGRWWRTKIHPVLDDEGNVVKLATYVQDITEHKKHEEKSLKEQQKYYSSLVENSSDVISIIEKDGTIRYQSPSVEKIFGYKPEEMIGKNFNEFIHPDESSFMSKDFTEFVRKRGSIGTLTEYRVKHKKGNWIYCESTRNNQLENPFIRGVIANTRDISERKKIRQKIVESEEKFRTLSEQSLMGMIILQDNQIQYLNNAMLAMLGYSREDILKEGINILSKIIHPDYYSFTMEQLRKKQDGEKDVVTHYPVKIITKNGKIRWVDIFSRTVLFKGKNADFATYVDITETIKAQEEVRKTKEYLQDIINSTSELILVVDKDLKITTWNKTAENITGFKSKEVIGKSIKSLDLFEDINSISDYLGDIKKSKTIPFYELFLKTKTGAKKILKVTYSSLQTETEHKKSILIMGKDITEDSEIHGKLIIGNSYLITEKTNDSAIHLYKDLILSGYNGLFITRDTPEAIQNVIHSLENIKILLLSQDKVSRFENVVDLDELTIKIDKFTKTITRPIILLDRIDYLLTNFSFDACIKSLYKITNIVAKNKGILFLRLNPSVINNSQLALLKEEFKQLPSQKIHDIQLEDNLYDVLTFVNEQNKNNTVVTYKKVSRNFSISKVTTAKRLNIIKDKGLIIIKKHGKTKTIHITEKGRTLLNRRKII